MEYTLEQLKKDMMEMGYPKTTYESRGTELAYRLCVQHLADMGETAIRIVEDARAERENLKKAKNEALETVYEYQNRMNEIQKQVRALNEREAAIEERENQVLIPESKGLLYRMALADEFDERIGGLETPQNRTAYILGLSRILGIPYEEDELSMEDLEKAKEVVEKYASKKSKANKKWSRRYD